MENMGVVSNFLEIGRLLFGPDVKIRYEVKNDTQDSDPAELAFYLEREFDDIVYTAEKWYEAFVTTRGILLTDRGGDYYFEKDNFQSNISTLEDVIS